MIKKVIKRKALMYDNIFIYTILPDTQEKTNLKVYVLTIMKISPNLDTNEQEKYWKKTDKGQESVNK